MPRFGMTGSARPEWTAPEKTGVEQRLPSVSSSEQDTVGPDHSPKVNNKINIIGGHWDKFFTYVPDYHYWKRLETVPDAAFKQADMANFVQPYFLREIF